MPKDKTLAEINEYAKTIHPDAKARWNDYNWVIEIPTEFVGPIELPESFRDTPAWEADHEYEGSYGSTLARWAYKNGYGSQPIEIVAMHYNLQMNRYGYEYEWFKNEVERLGLTEEYEEFEKHPEKYVDAFVSDELREVFRRRYNSNEAAAYANEKLAPEYEKLRELEN